MRLRGPAALLLLGSFLLLAGGGACGAVKTALATGNWNTAGTWNPSGVPAPGDDVVIDGGFTVTMDVSPTVNLLTIGGATAGTLQLGSSAVAGALSLTVNGTLTVSANGILRHTGARNGQHTLAINESVSNAGSVDLFVNANRNIAITFGGAGNTTVTGAGTWDSYLVTFNKSAASATVTNQSTGFWTRAGWTNAAPVTFTQGIYVHDTVSTFDMSSLDTDAAAAIEVNAGIRVLQGAVSIWAGSGGTGGVLTLVGRLDIQGGTVGVGDAADEGIAFQTGAVFSMSNGALTCAGRFCNNTTADTITWTQNGGTITLNVVGSTSATLAPFHMAAAGSSFTMGGGAIILQRASSATAEYINLAGTSSVTAGTIQFGNVNTPSATTFRINSTVPVFNLLVNGDQAGATDPTLQPVTNSLTVGNDVTIAAACTLNSNALDFSIGGNWTNNGTFVQGTRTVTFNGTAGTQVIAGTTGTTFNNLAHTGAGILQLSTNNLTVAGTLTNSAGAGNFDANGLGVTVTGLTTMSAGTYLASTGTQTLNGGLTLSGGSFGGSTGTVSVTSVTISNAASTLTAPSAAVDFFVFGNWSLTAGTFAHNSGTVKFGATAGTQTLASGGASFNHVSHNGTGTLQLLTGALTVGGTFGNAAGTFDANGLATTVTGLTTVSGGTYLASTATQTFTGGLLVNGGTFAGSTGSVAVPGSVSLTSGTLTAPSGPFTVSGDWSISGGTFTPGAGTVTFDGSNAQTIGGTVGSTFNSLTLANTSAADPNVTYNATGATLTVSGVLTVSNTTRLAAASKTISAFGSVVFNATFTQNSGTFQFSAAAQTMGGSAATAPTFADVVVTGGITTLSAADDIDMTVEGTLNIAGTGTLTCGDANDITIVTGTWDNDGTFTHGANSTQTVTFSGTGTYQGAVITTFQNVTFTGGTTTMSALDDTDLTVDTTLNITGTGTLACGDANDITISTAIWDNDGTFTHGANATQTVTFLGACTYQGSVTTTFQSVTFTGGTTTMVATDDTDMTVDTTLSITATGGLTCGDANDITVVTGTWDNDGTFTHGANVAQLVTFDSGANIYSGAATTTFRNVTISNGTTTMDGTDDTDMTVNGLLLIATAATSGTLALADANMLTVSTTGTLQMNGTSATSAPTVFLAPASSVVINGTFLTTWAGGANLKAAVDGTAVGAANFDLLGASVNVNGLAFSDGDANGLEVGQNGATNCTILDFRNVDFTNAASGGRHMTVTASGGFNLAGYGCAFDASYNPATGANVRVDENGGAGDVTVTMVGASGAGAGQEAGEGTPTGGVDDDAPGGPSAVALRDGYCEWVFGGDSLTPSPGVGETRTDPSTFTGTQGGLVAQYNWNDGTFVGNYVLARTTETMFGIPYDVIWKLDANGVRQYRYLIMDQALLGRVIGPPWTATIGSSGSGLDDEVVMFFTTLGYIFVVQDTGAALVNYGPYPLRPRSSVTYATEVCDTGYSLVIYNAGADFTGGTADDRFYLCGANVGSNEVYVTRCFTAGQEAQCVGGWPMALPSGPSRSWMNYQDLGGTEYLHIGTDSDADPDTPGATAHIFRVNLSTGAIDQEYPGLPGSHVRGGLMLLDDPGFPNDGRLYAGCFEDAAGGDQASFFSIITDSTGPGTYVDEWAPNALGTGDVDSLPWFDNTQLYVGDSDGVFYILNRATGATTWFPSLEVGVPIRGLPFTILDQGPVYVGNDNGKVFSVDIATGAVQRIWRLGDGRKVRSLSLTFDSIGNTLVAAITSDGYVFLIKP